MNQDTEPLSKSQNRIVIVNGNKTNQEKCPPTTKEEDVDHILHDEKDIKDTICGIGPFKPKWLQHLARKEMYIVVYCMTGMMHGMFFTYSVSVLSTIEKRFRLTSKQTGTVLSGNDISQVILSIILGYYGNYGHRPRWMSIGVMMAAMSGFFAALPHFIYGPGEDAIAIAQASKSNHEGWNFTDLEKNKQELCQFQPDIDCSEDGLGGGAYIGPVIFFFVSQFCVGITVSIFYSIGVTYMDDNISKKSYPLYYAITFMLRILGPVSGYFMGGKCLSLWIDPVEHPNITDEDPRWYGAWWIGYLFIGTNLLIAGALLVLFPRKLPATLRRETKRVIRQAEKDKEEGNDRGVVYFASLAKNKKVEREKPTLTNLTKALKRIFTNKIWVGNLFNTVVYVIAASGYWNFKPKYLENQFRKSTSESSYYTGVASLVSLVVGTGIGGAVLRWIQPSPRFVTGYNIFITLLQSTSYIALMFVGCPRLNVVGPVDGALAPPCSNSCGCTDRYTPICSEDQTTLFYSPCFAGCTEVDTSVSPIVYSGCRCITNSTNPLDRTFMDEYGNMTAESTSFGSATSGYCDEQCGTFIYYIIIQMIVKSIASTGRVGSSLIHIRSVADEDKGVALGTLTVCMSLFAFIPAPIIMGAIVDSACLVWDNTCGNYGNCWLYDSDKFRIIIHMVPAVFIFISVFGDIVVYYYSRQLDLYGDHEDDIDVEKREQKTEESQPLKKEENEIIENEEDKHGNETIENEKNMKENGIIDNKKCERENGININENNKKDDGVSENERNMMNENLINVKGEAKENKIEEYKKNMKENVMNDEEENMKENRINEEEESKENGMNEVEENKENGIHEEENKEMGINEEENKENGIKENENKENRMNEEVENKEKGINEGDENKENGINEGEENKENGINEGDENKENGINEGEENKENGINEGEENKENGINEGVENEENGINEAENRENGINEAEENREIGINEDENRENGINEAEENREIGINEDENRENGINEAEEKKEIGINEDENRENGIKDVNNQNTNEKSMIENRTNDEDKSTEQASKESG